MPITRNGCWWEDGIRHAHASVGMAPCEPEILLVFRPFVTMFEVDSPLALPTYAMKAP